MSQPLPLTVVSGYLGAGKTSLINHLLRHAGGRRIMVLVNDFGALNIDADLLESAEEDTLTLSNGCVCCTLGGDLFYALANALDRRPRPDYLVIEASGVAQPAKIAMAAQAEPELALGGIVTLVDAANIATLLADPLIGGQVAEQIESADLLILTKTDIADETAARAAIAEHSASPVVVARHGAVPADLLLGLPGGGSLPEPAHLHHYELYASWSYAGRDRVTLATFRQLLERPPSGLYRLKGRVLLRGGGALEAHLVGRQASITPCPEPEETRLVAIGPKPLFDPGALETVWRHVLDKDGDAPASPASLSRRLVVSRLA